MPLPTPSLDDRRFQDLVDDAKRRIQIQCPAWTDHNVSDPGITLVEVFAWMTDQLLHRLNQVPDRMYVKFLELLGVRLEPPAAARAPVTFWLSKPQPDPVVIPVGTEVSTVRTEAAAAISFSVVEELTIVPCELSQVAAVTASGKIRELTEALRFKETFLCFDETPQPGDALLIGLSSAVPSCAITLRFDCTVAEGRGVDPRDPPLVWEAMDPSSEGGWTACDVESDQTGGLNRTGDVRLHVPKSHVAVPLGKMRAGWLRCRVVAPRDERQRRYVQSPTIRGLTASTVGGTALAVNAAVFENEALGISDGTPGQRFRLVQHPVVIDRTEDVLDMVVQVATADGWEDWQRVDSFVDSRPGDRHFLLEEVDGVVAFGPAVREPDGSLTCYGATPAAGAAVRARSYRSGGGMQGNVAAGAIKMTKSSIPLIGKVANRHPAEGGREGESLDSAKVRGPMQLRGTRAVAARDYEHQARRAAPDDIARVKCLPAGTGGPDAGHVLVLVVPHVADDDKGTPPFNRLRELNRSLVQCIEEHLDERRTVGALVLVEPPLYTGIAVEARIHAAENVDARVLSDEALRALYRYFHPIRGGPDGDGWPFGRPVLKGEVFAVLQRVSGVDLVEDVQLYESNPINNQRADEPTDRIDLLPRALVYSHLHTIEVVRAPTAPDRAPAATPTRRRAR